MKTKALLAVLDFSRTLTSCSKNEPSREAVSHKDDCKEPHIYGFSMIAVYKAMYEFNIDKSNRQYNDPFNAVANKARVFTPQDTAIVTPNSDTPYSVVQAGRRAGISTGPTCCE